MQSEEMDSLKKDSGKCEAKDLSGSEQSRLPTREGDEENPSGNENRATLIGFLSENMERLLNEEMYAVVPLPGCPHLTELRAVPATGIDVGTPCVECGTREENWICLICYTVYCGRYIQQHMVSHNVESSHSLTLSFADLSVWCYACEAYVDNMALYPAKNAAHRSKFGSDLNWTYQSPMNSVPSSQGT